MKIAKYKRGLVSQNPREFCDTLKELRDDLKLEKNIYSAIKRINKFLCKTIEEIDKTEIIENDLYRIIPYKYSFIYMLAIAFQTEVEVCEQDIVIYKRKEMYSFSKRMGKSPENICERVILERSITDILQIVESFTENKMYGFKDIYEINEVIKESNLIKAIGNIGILEKQEYELRCKEEEDFWKQDVRTMNIKMDEHFSEMAKNKRLMIEEDLAGILLKSKITILHIPLFHKQFPSIYLSGLNAVIVAEYMQDKIKESTFLAEFGLYLQYRLTGDIRKLPLGFKLSKPTFDLMQAQNLFFDLFAYKLMEGTSLEDKNVMKNKLKHFPFAMREFLKDASYFDILVE